MSKGVEKIFVIGGGGHAKVVASVLKKHPCWDPVGYIEISDKNLLLGLRFLGNDSEIKQIMNRFEVNSAAIGIGYAGDHEYRRNVIQRVLDLNVSMPVIISTDARVQESTEIGDGTIVMDGSTIQPGTVIGNYSILNTNTSIDHDCSLGDNVHLAPGVTVCGHVTINDNVFVGAGSTIINGISIVGNATIGAGSVVIRSIEKPGLYVGNPARLISKSSLVGRL